MKLGIIRALLYHKYHIFWETFFEELEVETIISPPTNKDIFECGVKCTLSEICLPIKIFFGHVMYLKDKVDFIFLPRIVSVEKRKGRHSYTCPKMIGLPDMIKATFSNLKTLELVINIKEKSQFISYLKLGLKLKKSIYKTIKAYIKANQAQKKFEKENLKTFTSIDKNLKIALLSHSYNLCETYPINNIKNMLCKLDCLPLTVEMFPRKTLLKEADLIFPELSWNYERELLGAASYIIKNNLVDGIIMVANFGCGPDSLVADYIMRIAKKEKNIKATLITVDEHTQHSGIETRLEAFVDLLNFSKKKTI